MASGSTISQFDIVRFFRGRIGESSENPPPTHGPFFSVHDRRISVDDPYGDARGSGHDDSGDWEVVDPAPSGAEDGVAAAPAPAPEDGSPPPPPPPPARAARAPRRPPMTVKEKAAAGKKKIGIWARSEVITPHAKGGKTTIWLPLYGCHAADLKREIKKAEKLFKETGHRPEQYFTSLGSRMYVSVIEGYNNYLFKITI